MQTTLAVLLLLNAVFNVVVWPRFAIRVFKDPRARDENGRATTFLTVHVVLFSVAAVISVVSAVFGLVGLF